MNKYTLVRSSYGGHGATSFSADTLEELMQMFEKRISEDENFFTSDHYVRVNGPNKFIGRSHQRTSKDIFREILSQWTHMEERNRYATYFDITPDRYDRIGKALANKEDNYEEYIDEESYEEDSWERDLHS